MKIVIPVSQSDSHQLPLLVDVLLHHGAQGASHIYWLVATPSVVQVAEEQAVRLRTICQEVQVHNTGVEFPGGWPQAPNNHWHWTVSNLDRSGNRQAWLWLEVDVVPMVRDWAAQLEEGYRMAGKPFFGHVKPLRFKREGSAELYTKPGEDMLMGVAIYPPGISQDVEIAPLFNNLGRRGPQGVKEPFDMYLRWVMKKRGRADTPVIQDKWRSCNYRYEGTILHCVPILGEPNALGGAVEGSPVLMHGCKDGSLHKLIVGQVKKPAATTDIECSGPPKAGENTTITPKPADETEAKILAFITQTKRRTKDLETWFSEVPKPKRSEILLRNGFTVTSGGWIIKAKEDEV